MTRQKVSPKVRLREVNRSPEEKNARRLQALIDQLAAKYREGRGDDDDDDEPRAARDQQKPELLRYWERISQRWDELAQEVTVWSRVDHPMIHACARTQAHHGHHGRSDLQLNEIDRLVRERAGAAQKRLEALHRDIEAVTRENPRERGATLTQIEGVANDNAPVALWTEKARSALTEWWKDKGSNNKRGAACWWVSVLQRRSDTLPVFVDVRTFGVNLDVLAADFAEARRRDPNLKGGAKNAAKWIVRKLVRGV